MTQMKSTVSLTVGGRAVGAYPLLQAGDLNFPVRDPSRVIRTAPRAPIEDLDSLPMVDRSMIDFARYSRAIGMAPMKNTVSILATRGCPFHCSYCHMIMSKKYRSRSPENIYDEILFYVKLGIRRFSFVDDIFNLGPRSTDLFRLIIAKGLDIKLFFPNGLRGDILSEDYIDLMIEAGTSYLALALETASPRLQKLIQKNMKLDKLQRAIEYIAQRHPKVILNLFTMMGFPTETEEEVLQTINFVKSITWIHFPYLNILKIYPGTQMEELARNNGITAAAITKGLSQQYNEVPETLPYSKAFARQVQMDLLTNYILNKDRLRAVLPHQTSLWAEDEFLQQYDSYLPLEVKSVGQLADFFGLPTSSFPVLDKLHAESRLIPDINQKLRSLSPYQDSDQRAFRFLLLDVSMPFSAKTSLLFGNLIEQPLGLLYILAYLKQRFGASINGKIAKSGVDFNSMAELQVIINDFQPKLVGVRTLSLYRDFFHETVAYVKQLMPDITIIAGGPYASSCVDDVASDPNVDIVVVNEGEVTMGELYQSILDRGGHIPDKRQLMGIPGLAFKDDIQLQTEPNEEQSKEVEKKAGA
jgi:radical SAM superfamily enzyme YgiQ (UPF0313 family)